jgi:hypothetical protein
MILSNKQGGNFTPHEEGAFRGVCVDVTPLVKQQSKYGERDVFRLVFETDAPAREDGSRQCVWSRGFTPSLNEKANFRKFLRQWRGRDLTAEEERAFDAEALVGMPAQLVITHDHAENGETYANIAACTPYRGNDPLQPSGKFTRKKDRDAAKAAGGNGDAPAAPEGETAGYRKAAQPDAKPREAVDGTKAGEDWAAVKVHVGRHAGVELRDLDADAIQKLVDNWLPIHKANPKPTADDKRLAVALVMAAEVLAGAGEGGAF